MKDIVEESEKTPQKSRFSPYPTSLGAKSGASTSSTSGASSTKAASRHSQRIANSIVKRGARVNSIKNRTQNKVRPNYVYKKDLETLPNKYLPGTNTPLPGLTDAEVQALAERVPQSIAYHNKRYNEAKANRSLLNPFGKLL